jgi:hypothetical protein
VLPLWTHALTTIRKVGGRTYRSPYGLDGVPHWIRFAHKVACMRRNAGCSPSQREMPCLYNQGIARRSVREARGWRLGDRAHKIRLFVRNEGSMKTSMTGLFVYAPLLRNIFVSGGRPSIPAFKDANASSSGTGGLRQLGERRRYRDRTQRGI